MFAITGEDGNYKTVANFRISRAWRPRQKKEQLLGILLQLFGLPTADWELFD